jgi:hypothetical protein
MTETLYINNKEIIKINNLMVDGLINRWVGDESMHFMGRWLKMKQVNDGYHLWMLSDLLILMPQQMC